MRNAQQRAAMAIIAETPKPEGDHAKTLLELAKASALPARITEGLEAFIRAANVAGRKAVEAKDAAAAASDCWKTIREQAGRTEDLFDDAEDAGAGTSTPTPGNAFLDHIEECFPEAFAFYGETLDAGSPDPAAEYLAGLALGDADTKAGVPTLSVLLCAACSALAEGLASDRARHVVLEFLRRAKDISTAPGGVAQADAIADAMGDVIADSAISFSALVQSALPEVFDVLDGAVLPSAADSAALELARDICHHLDSELATDERFAQIEAELDMRAEAAEAAAEKARVAAEKKAARAKTAKAPKGAKGSGAPEPGVTAVSPDEFNKALAANKSARATADANA